MNLMGYLYVKSTTRLDKRLHDAYRTRIIFMTRFIDTVPRAFLIQIDAAFDADSSTASSAASNDSPAQFPLSSVSVSESLSEGSFTKVNGDGTESRCRSSRFVEGIGSFGIFVIRL
jgi:uncharacterized protein